jgi:hypothetical protein
MKRFQFSLEHAMQLRRLRADMERARLEALYAELRQIDVQKRNLEAEESAAHNQVKTQNSVWSQQLIALDRFTHHMGTRKEHLEARRVDFFRQVAEQQVRLVDAERKFELLEKLKTEKKAGWTAAFDREQEELASEVYLAKWERQCS